MPTEQLMTQVIISEPGGPEVLKAVKAPIPEPKAGEVLVRVEAGGVNRPDVMQRQGAYPMPPGVTPVPGLEIAGTIVAFGEGISGFSVDDKVCGLTNGGGYAEYCVVPAGQLLPVPQGMDMASAAALPETFFTVWANLFGLGRARAGEEVLIHGGASGIGTTALMLCVELGIKAHATVGSPAKADAVAQLGGYPINRQADDFAKVILERTGHRGVDVILDIGGGGIFNKNMESLAMDGRLVMIGFMDGTIANEVDLMNILAKRAIVTGSLMRPRSLAEKSLIAEQLLREVWPILDAGRCHPIISQRFTLDHAAQAHRVIEDANNIGKVVLMM